MGKKSSAALSTVTVLSDDRIEPPGHLTEAQADEWRAIVDSLPADYFRPGDVPLLSAFCVASAMHKEAQQHIQDHGMVIQNERGNLCANPAAGILATQAASMAQMAMKLRLCPSSRMRAESVKTGGTGGGSRPWQVGG